jgi:hypothetical protein
MHCRGTEERVRQETVRTLKPVPTQTEVGGFPQRKILG